MRVSRRAATAVVAGAAAWAALCGVTYGRAFGSRRWGNDAGRGWTPDDVELAHHLLPVRTEDGVDLLAWHLEGRLPAAVIISGGHRGRAGDVLGIGGALNRAGFHVVTFGWRGTPGSGAAPHTLGAHERRDLEAVLDATAGALPGVPIGLLGFSLGAAVSILVAADDPRIAAVCADSGFAAAADVVADSVRRVLHLPGRAVAAPVRLALRLRTGADLAGARPVDAVGRIAPRPLLLIHGGRDAQVPPEHARRLAAAAGPTADLWLIPDAIHVGAYFDDRSVYRERVTAFFAAALGVAGTVTARS